MFDAEKVTKACVQWIREFFKDNGPDSPAVVAISGGKDSSVVAALCVEALGRDRVIGVMMPNGVQHDIDCSQKLIDHLGIKSYTVNVHDAINGVLNNIPKELTLSEQARINLAPRIRMSTVYAV